MQVVSLQKYGMNLNYITFNKIPEVIDNNKKVNKNNNFQVVNLIKK